MIYLWIFFKRLPKYWVICDCGLQLPIVFMVTVIIIDTCMALCSNRIHCLIICYFYSKLLEDATSENERLTEILQVRDETERKQAGA